MLEKYILLYKRYLHHKWIFNIFHKLSPQRLDLKTLDIFFEDYFYSFDIFTKSNLKRKFDYKTNYITKFFLKTEFLKFKSFQELEKITINLLKENTF
jgi:hypothetical protein